MADPSRQSTTPPRSAWFRLCQWLWNQRGFLWGTVIIGVALNLFASWLITPLGTTFSQTPLGTLLGHPLLFALGGVSLLGLTGILWHINRRYPAPPQQEGSTRPLTQQQNRQTVIDRLCMEYDKQLKDMLQDDGMMKLGLHERTDVISSSAQMINPRTDIPPETTPLPSGTTICGVYDNAGQRLLILGAPGTGKTTLLLDLAQKLLERAQSDPILPIPVILNLSSWASKKPPLISWLIDQIFLAYDLSSPTSRALLEQDQWLLLLDGLDEVETSARSACIKVINQYQKEHRVHLVVCSRSHEYLTQQDRLVVFRAVEIQPLQSEEVTKYLKDIGKPTATVRRARALHNNPVLEQLLTTPLMLSVVIRAYRGKAVKDLHGSVDDQQRQIFTCYVERMLERGSAKSGFMPKQTLHWLTCLAKQMQQTYLAEFYVEQIQPTWLPTQQAQRLYQVVVWLGVGFVAALLLNLANLLTDGIFYHRSYDLLALLRNFPFYLVIGLFIAIPSAIRGEIEPIEVLRWNWGPPKEELNELWKFLWGRKWSFLFFFLLPLVVIIGGVNWTVLGRVYMGFLESFLWMLLLVLVPTLFIAMMLGLRKEKLEKKHRTSPNQGIWRSAWNSLVIGLIYGPTIGLLLGLLSRAVIREGGAFGNFVIGFETGLIIGLFIGLFSGGTAFLKHFILRLILWCRSVMPWRYARFLEEAHERILLQRVGGGYRFVPLFQDYFASL
jgi:hypothetical protein